MENLNKLPFYFWLTLGIALVSVIINIIIFVVLFQIKREAANAATEAANIIQQAQTKSLTAPFTANVAIDKIFDIPIQTTVPIKTTAIVPIAIPLTGQTVNVQVPIDTTVPISLIAHVPIKQTIPVNVDIANSPLNDTLNQLQDWLTKLASRLK